MRERIREDLLARRSAEAKSKAQEEIIRKIIKASEIAIPQSKIESYAESMYEDMKRRAPRIKHEEAIPRCREMAEQDLKRFRVLDFVAKTENIKPAQGEVDERIREYAALRNENFEEIKERFRKDGTALMIRSDLRERKTLEWLVENNG
jgi:FKBP-type peptidyl-prolyl cis-trans isomerase (trigger factor)